SDRGTGALRPVARAAARRSARDPHAGSRRDPPPPAPPGASLPPGGRSSRARRAPRSTAARRARATRPVESARNRPARQRAARAPGNRERRRSETSMRYPSRPLGEVLLDEHDLRLPTALVLLERLCTPCQRDAIEAGLGDGEHRAVRALLQLEDDER